MSMKILTAGSALEQAQDAVQAIKAKLVKNEQVNPSFLLIYFSSQYDENQLRTLFLQEFPGVNFTGVLSASGAFAQDIVSGFSEPEKKQPGKSAAGNSRFSVYKMKNAPSGGTALGGINVMAFFDEKASFGSVLVPVTDTTNLMASKAIREAQEQANRLGVMPDLMLLHEEQVPVTELRAEINNVLGASIPIVGGGIPGRQEKARGFTQDTVCSGGAFYLLTLLYVQCKIAIESHSTCECEDIGAAVTRSSDYVIAELDHQPAADLFFRWIGKDTVGMSVAQMQDLIPEVSNSYFIGRQKNSIRGEISYDMSVIWDVTPNRGLVTSRYWNKQDEIKLMRNDNTELFRCFLSTGNNNSDQMIGALHIMCMSFSQGGNKANFYSKVVEPVRKMYGDKVFMVSALDGEFGKDIEGGLILGNYTVSTVYFLEW